MPAAQRRQLLGPRQAGCEIIAALMKGSRTAEELNKASGVSMNSVRLWLREMVASGIVHRAAGKKPAGSTGRAPVRYSLQAAPFARADWS